MVNLRCEFPVRFFEEEKKCGYIVSKHMKKVWAVELDLLHELMQVCTKYNITFYLSGGTLLGAIRHHGIIPWDDDIDVMMFRKDYDRLCEIGSKEFQHPYFFQTEYTDKGCLREHIQLRNSETTGILKNEWNTGRHFNQGIFIDIFPLDNVPDDLNERKKYLITAEKLRRRYKRKAFQSIYYKFRLRKNVFAMGRDLAAHLLYCVWPSLSYFNYEEAYHKFEEYSKSYNQMETNSVVSVPFFREKDVKERSWLKEIKDHPFEFMSMPIPIEYDKILTRIYGDYQKPVMGTSDHGGVFFDTEKSYKEYI